MPLTIDKTTGMVTITISREQDLLQAIQAASEAMLNDPDFRPGSDSLWDIRQVDTTSMGTEDILYLIEFMKRHKARRGAGYKIAIVTDCDLLFGGARMFASLSDSEPFTCKVFRDMPEARRWISGKR